MQQQAEGVQLGSCKTVSLPHPARIISNTEAQARLGSDLAVLAVSKCYNSAGVARRFVWNPAFKLDGRLPG
jgi:hypothetical protein